MRLAILLLITALASVRALPQNSETALSHHGIDVAQVRASILKAKPTVETVRGYFREYAVGQVSSGPAIVTVDADDNVWVALAKSGKLVRLANGGIDVFDVGAESRPVGLVAGSRANGQANVIWIAASYDNKLIRFDIALKQTREYKIDGESSWPFNVALAPDGTVWFTERAAGKIGRLNPGTGEVRHYDVPTPNCGPAGLAVDMRSGRVWFTESYADRVGALDPKTGVIVEYKMSDTSTGLVSGPAGLALDAQGGVWFTKLEGKFGHLAAGSDHIETIDVPVEAKRPAGITVAPDGKVWAAALDGNLLLSYNPAEPHFQIYPIPTGESDARPSTPPLAKTSRPFGIAFDRQGNIWFSQQYTGQLAVLDIAPPELTVLSPEGTVRTADTLLTVQALDRVAGVEQLTVKLDGKPVVLDHGRLDLRNSLPGPHKLEVAVMDAAGLTAIAASSFNYAPGPFALAEILERLEPKNESGKATREVLVLAARDLTKGDIRTKLNELHRQIRANAKMFEPFPLATLEAAIDFHMRNAAQVVEVQILDQSPYFSQTEVVVRTGDTVQWKYAPPSDGHSISHYLHRIEIQGVQIRSGLLRSGETFTQRFEHSGEFAVKDTENPGSNMIVKVLP